MVLLVLPALARALLLPDPLAASELRPKRVVGDSVNMVTALSNPRVKPRKGRVRDSLKEGRVAHAHTQHTHTHTHTQRVMSGASNRMSAVGGLGREG